MNYTMDLQMFALDLTAANTWTGAATAVINAGDPITIGYNSATDTYSTYDNQTAVPAGDAYIGTVTSNANTTAVGVITAGTIDSLNLAVAPTDGQDIVLDTTLDVTVSGNGVASSTFTDSTSTDVFKVTGSGATFVAATATSGGTIQLRNVTGTVAIDPLAAGAMAGVEIVGGNNVSLGAGTDGVTYIAGSTLANTKVTTPTSGTLVVSEVGTSNGVDTVITDTGAVNTGVTVVGLEVGSTISSDSVDVTITGYTALDGLAMLPAGVIESANVTGMEMTAKKRGVAMGAATTVARDVGSTATWDGTNATFTSGAFSGVTNGDMISLANGTQLVLADVPNDVQATLQGTSSTTNGEGVIAIAAGTVGLRGLHDVSVVANADHPVGGAIEFYIEGTDLNGAATDNITVLSKGASATVSAEGDITLNSGEYATVGTAVAAARAGIDGAIAINSTSSVTIDNVKFSGSSVSALNTAANTYTEITNARVEDLGGMVVTNFIGVDTSATVLGDSITAAAARDMVFNSSNGQFTLVHGTFQNQRAASTLNVQTESADDVIVSSTAGNAVTFGQSSTGTFSDRATTLSQGTLIVSDNYSDANGSVNGFIYQNGGAGALNFRYVNGQASVTSTNGNTITDVVEQDATTGQPISGNRTTKTVYISSQDGTKTSVITTPFNMGNITVTPGTTISDVNYTIGLNNMANGEAITIDGTTFTYTANGTTAVLTNGTTAYNFANGVANGITVTAADGTSSFTDVFQNYYVTDTEATRQGVLTLTTTDADNTRITGTTGNLTSNSGMFKDGDTLYSDGVVNAAGNMGLSYTSLPGSIALGTLNYNNEGDAPIFGFTAASDARAQQITAAGTDPLGNKSIWSITGGNGADTLTGNNAGSTLAGGAGNDSLVSAGEKDVLLGGEGNDTFDVSTASAVLTDYVYSDDSLKVSSSDLTALTLANLGKDGVVTLSGSNRIVDLSAGTGTGDVFAVSATDGTNTRNVAWTKSGGGTIEYQDARENIVMIGADDGSNALYSGNGNDTLLSYAANDTLYGGAGDDSIRLTSTLTGGVVGIGTASGSDTVTGFTLGFEGGDRLELMSGFARDVSASVSNGSLIFTDGNGSMEIKSATPSNTTKAYELKVGAAKVAVAPANTTIKTDDANYADYYVATALDFTGADKGVNVDLRRGFDSEAAGAKYQGTHTVTAGAGADTLIGSTEADKLIGGTNYTTVWGGYGKDTLVGGTGVDTFFIDVEDSTDVVTGFTTADKANADIAHVGDSLNYSALTKDGVEIGSSSTDKLVLKGLNANSKVHYSDSKIEGIGKIGYANQSNSFTYEDDVTYYGGGTDSDAITMSKDGTAHELWMDNQKGVIYNSIEVVDGSKADGSLLVAGTASLNQSIKGGAGDTTLWGGAGGNDTLVSGSGATSFYFEEGSGNDIIQNYKSTDIVDMHMFKTTDMVSTNVDTTAKTVTFVTQNGSSLTVNNMTSGVTAKFSDGTYTSNAEGTWDKAE